jgi:hypothetical protein
MKKVLIAVSGLITISSTMISIVYLFLIRQIEPSGDLFSQINTSIFCGFAFGFLVLSARKKLSTKSGYWRNLHLLLTVHLTLFISLQFTLVNIDRSRSFYVLSWANQNKVFDSKDGVTLVGVQSQEKLNLLAIEVRLGEQIEKNFLELDRNQIKPTVTGKFMLWIANSLANIFNLENWKLNKN